MRRPTEDEKNYLAEKENELVLSTEQVPTSREAIFKCFKLLGDIVELQNKLLTEQYKEKSGV